MGKVGNAIMQSMGYASIISGILAIVAGIGVRNGYFQLDPDLWDEMLILYGFLTFFSIIVGMFGCLAADISKCHAAVFKCIIGMFIGISAIFVMIIGLGGGSSYNYPDTFWYWYWMW
ncbi:MAG: hypothetical protein ACFFCS_06715 [Candidatus Hodarchaeota archaeon]